MPDDPAASPGDPPLAQLDYGGARHYGRPGALTAIGILSIVVACLSAITNFGMGFDAFIFYGMGSSFPRAARSPTNLAFPHINGWAAAWACASAVMGVLLAIYLFVIGILLLARDDANARKRHIQYAWIKLPLTLVGAAAVGNMFSEFVGNASMVTGGIGAHFGLILFAIYFLVFFCMGAAYPIALLITFSRPAIKAWFAIGRAK
jgi:hypothetical protein